MKARGGRIYARERLAASLETHLHLGFKRRREFRVQCVKISGMRADIIL